MKAKFILIVFSIIIILSAAYGDAIGSENQPEPGKTIVFSTMFTESLSSFHGMLFVYSEAFKRLGWNFRLVSLPGERSIVDANSGAVDGEAARVAHLNSDNYPNLIQVPEPIMVAKEGAYSTDTSIRINGWESLGGKGFKVGLLKGLKSVEKKITPVC